MAHSVNWDSLFETKPPGGDNPVRGDDKIRETRSAFEERMALEHLFDYSDVNNQGYHRQGSALAYYQSTTPTTLPDGTALGSNTRSSGRLWVDSDNGYIYYYNGADFKLSQSLPVGAIIFVHGSWTDNSTIPGWYQCTAINAAAQGVANLEDKFIVITGTYSLNDTGGEATHALITAELAAHGHTVTVNAESAHTHYVTRWAGALSGMSEGSTSMLASSGAYGSDSSYDVGAGTSGTLTGKTYAGSSHTHTASSGSTGSGTAHNNLPPYYALIAVERVS